MVSALVGQPPITDDDYWVVRGLLISIGLTDVSPKAGAQIPPARPPPDRYHYETKGPGIIAGMVVCIVVMTAVTGARLMVRLRKRELRFGPDDWLIIPALILSLGWPVLQIASVHYSGAGKHLYDVTYHDLYMFNWFSTVQKMIFFLAVATIKMSIVMFNMRLTGLTSHKWMIAHWTFFGTLIVYWLTAFFMVTFQCSPPSAGFNSVAAGKLNSPPKCISETTLGDILSSWHVASDFCLLSVPVIVLWKVRMPWPRKARLFAVFSVGAMSCIGSVVRQVDQSRLSVDPLWNFTGILTWTMVDLVFAIIVASLPVLSSLLWSYGTHKSSNYTPGSNSGLESGSNPSAFKKALRPLHSKSSMRSSMQQDQIELQGATREHEYVHEVRQEPDFMSSGKNLSGKEQAETTRRHHMEYETDPEYAREHQLERSRDTSRVYVKEEAETRPWGGAV